MRSIPSPCSFWLISHQPAVFFSQNKPATNNQPAVLFSQNKPAPAISHQPNEHAEVLIELDLTYCSSFVSATSEGVLGGLADP
jgi:hypothetical protein